MIKNSYFKILSVVAASTLVAACASGEESLPADTASSVASSQGGLEFSSESSTPGDNIKGQFFETLDPLRNFIEKIQVATSETANQDVMVVAEGDYFSNQYYSYNIFEPSTGLRVDYAYYSYLDEQACTLPVIMEFNSSQNSDFNLPYNERLNLFDVEMFTDTVFNNVYGAVETLPADGWVVNGLNVVVLSGDYYFKHIALNSDGSLASIANYMHQNEPEYGFPAVGGGDDEFVFDENGEIVFDENGDPVLNTAEAESGENVDSREQIAEAVLTPGFNGESLKAFASPIVDTRFTYDRSANLNAFKDVDTSVDWWLNVGEENQSNPSYYADALSIGGGVGVVSDGTLFTYSGDYYSGLQVSGNVVLKDSSSFSCAPIGEGEDIEYREQLDDTFNENRATAEEYGVEIDEFGVGGDGEVFIEGF